jgi:hypothetical protein
MSPAVKRLIAQAKANLQEARGDLRAGRLLLAIEELICAVVAIKIAHVLRKRSRKRKCI